MMSKFLMKQASITDNFISELVEGIRSFDLFPSSQYKDLYSNTIEELYQQNAKAIADQMNLAVLSTHMAHVPDMELANVSSGLERYQDLLAKMQEASHRVEVVLNDNHLELGELDSAIHRAANVVAEQQRVMAYAQQRAIVSAVELNKVLSDAAQSAIANLDANIKMSDYASNLATIAADYQWLTHVKKDSVK